MKTAFNNEIIIVTDPRCGETSAFNSLKELKLAMLECNWEPEDILAFLEDAPEIFDATYVCPTQRGGKIYLVEQNGRYSYYAVLAEIDVRLVLDLDHEAEPEELGEAGGILLENPYTGSIAPEAEWREIFEKSTPEEWGGETFEGALLEEVVLNQPGQPGYDEGYGDWRPYDG